MELELEKILKDVQDGEVSISLLNEDKNDYSKESFEILNQLAKNVDNISEKIKKVNLCVLNERLPYEVYSMLKKFYSITKKYFDLQLVVKHTTKNNAQNSVEKLWDFNTIAKANAYIYSICSFIKLKKLSPAEAIAYIHLKIQTVAKYSASKKRSWCSNDQIFAGAFLKRPEFVCAGYSSLFKQIVDELNMPELKCDVMTLYARNLDTNVEESHARLKLKIYDKKYNIDDEFYDDPTWDLKDGLLGYANLFLTSDCHSENLSKYDFMDFAIKKVDEKSFHSLQTYYTGDEWRSYYVKPLQQELVEEIVFTALSCFEFDDFEECFLTMKEMAKSSYNDQKSKRYKSTLTNENLILNKKRAHTIYQKNNEKSYESLTPSVL